MTCREDPLNEIFLTKEQTKWFNKGKQQTYLEMKRKDIKPPKLTIDQKRLLCMIKERENRIRIFEQLLDYFKNKYESADKKLSSILRIKELKAYPKLEKKIRKEAFKSLKNKKLEGK